MGSMVMRGSRRLPHSGSPHHPSQRHPSHQHPKNRCRPQPKVARKPVSESPQGTRIRSGLTASESPASKSPASESTASASPTFESTASELTVSESPAATHLPRLQTPPPLLASSGPLTSTAALGGTQDTSRHPARTFAPHPADNNCFQVNDTALGRRAAV